MLTSCYGYPLRTGTNIIAIVHLIASLIYIFYYGWQSSINYGYPKFEENNTLLIFSHYIKGSSYSEFTDEVFMNYTTSVFMIVGLVSIFASFGLRQATKKNETHKIYLWLLIGYIQLSTIVVIEIVVLARYTNGVKYAMGLIACFTLIDAVLVFHLLVVQSFYAEEKLVEETNYTTLHSELTSQIQQPAEDEFQNVQL